MNCSSCGHENRPNAKFCEECAAPLRRTCATCNAELRPSAKFCDECGAPTMARAAEPSSARKIITIVFADLVGSTALHERLDPESASRFMESYYAAMRGAVEAHGGSVTKLLGDGVTALFGTPRVSEDDAIRAVRAAVAMQQAFRELAEQRSEAVGKVGLRVAVNTGEVVASDDAEIIGDPVNVAARLQEQGRDGDVVIGEATQRLVAALVTLAPLGSFALKGRAEAVKAYRVTSLERPVGVTATAFVGRSAELASMKAVYESATKTPATRLAVVLGSPGLGKSRLIDEFATRLGEAATVLDAHCDAAGGATFAPLADALRKHLHVDDGASPDVLRAAIDAAFPSRQLTAHPGDDNERARVAAGIAALISGSPASPEETFFVVRRALAALAASKPVVLVIDDLHWAEPLLLDLVEHLVQWGSGVPLLVLVGARPELRDARSSLASAGGLVADVVSLAGLDAGAATRLAANVIGAADLPAAVAIKVLATSEGNPLFVGELVRMLVHEGALRQEGDRWTVGAELAALEMPPTIHALLAARIERLRPEDRTVLERAAVVGRHFSRGAVAELLPRDVQDLGTRLESLRRSELIEPDTGWFLGEPALRFHHVLIRDAAYRRLLKNTRAELHARLADWIEARAGGAVEYDETIGWHLEQAHQHLRELGPLDAPGRTLGERAAQRLAAAGRRALARDDVPLAAGLLGRAIQRLDDDDPARANLALDWCEALLSAGDVGPAATAIDELGRFIESSPRLRAWHTCFKGQLGVLTAPQSLHAAADSVAAAASELAALDDAGGEAKAYFVHALALARLGKVGASEAALDRALAAARRADDRRRANAVLAGAPLAALWGPSPVTRASGRCLDVVRVLRITQGAPAVEAVALSCQGVLEALRGRTDAARRMIASSRKMVEELGITHRLLEADVFAARIELLEGDAAAAEGVLRGAYEGLRDLGLGIDAARAAALLGRALLAQDRAAEAEALSKESETLAGDDLQAAIAWRGVRAEALARRGEHAAAIELARAAVEIAAATDALLDHADARLALAAALRAAGRGTDADAEERRATELWEAKGATLLAERARQDPLRGDPTPHTKQGEGMPRVQRRVRPNAATAVLASLETVYAARDFDALAALHSDPCVQIDHLYKVTYGRDGTLDAARRVFKGREPRARSEALATLGESLALARRWICTSKTSSRHFDVGESEREWIAVEEVDDHGRICRQEMFAPDRLGEALARLYERYAELLPAGPERTRSATTARLIGFMLTKSTDGDVRLDVEAMAMPTFEAVDHRLVGHATVRAVGAVFNRGVDAWRELTEATDVRVDDVLGLCPKMLLRRSTRTGVLRSSGGEFEIGVLKLSVFGADGRMIRQETFDVGHEAEALARFDELAEGPTLRPSHRRVRPNAATENAARLQAAIGARDADALFGLFADELNVMDHTTGVLFDSQGARRSFRSFMSAREPKCSHESLATLGDSLALSRMFVAAHGIAHGRVDVGAYEKEELHLIEVDAEGRRRWGEVFAVNHLGDGLARLYERYAELLPEGPRRARAMATARAVAVLAEPFRIEQFLAAYSPRVEIDDHRSAGFGALHGRAALMAAVRALLELSEDFDRCVDDVLAAAPGALLIRDRSYGKDRKSDKAFERHVYELLVYGQDGLVVRWERFDVGHEADALARFDELTGPARARPSSTRRRVRPNAATRVMEHLEAAFRASDLEAIGQVIGDRLDTIEHPTGSTYGREGQLESARRMLRMPGLAFTAEPLATLGESVCLSRRVVTASGSAAGRFDVADYEIEHVGVMEVDESGRLDRSEVFASDQLGKALTRLYERYAEKLPDGPERARVAESARAVAAMLEYMPDAPQLATAFTSDIEMIDTRTLGTWSARGIDAALAHFRSLKEVAHDIALRVDDLLGLTSEALLVQRMHSGTDRVSGGRYERQFLMLLGFAADGRIGRVEWFDCEHEAQALARFEQIIGCGTANRETRLPVDTFANAVTRANEHFLRVWETRDWSAIKATQTARFEDRRALMKLSTRNTEGVAGLRYLFDVPHCRWAFTLVATRGERLALNGVLFEGDAEERGGPLTIEYLCVQESDAQGRLVDLVLFDLADIDAAYEELDARYEAGEAKSSRIWALQKSETLAVTSRNWDDELRNQAPGFFVEDHRRLGLGSTLRDSTTFVNAQKALFDLTDDGRYRLDHFRMCERGILCQGAYVGTRHGGAFEMPFCHVAELDSTPRFRRLDSYDLEDVGKAIARFEELKARTETSRHRFANEATRVDARWKRNWDARDWEAVTSGVYAPEYHLDDRRSLMRMRSAGEDFLAQLRMLFFEVSDVHWHFEPMATRGERLVLNHMMVDGQVPDGGGPLSAEYLQIDEVDPEGRFTVSIAFDLEDVDAAYDELDARWRALDGNSHPRVMALDTAFRSALARRDWEALAACFGPSFVGYDHRLVSWGTLRGPREFLESIRAMFELAPDARARTDHVRASARALIQDGAWFGTRDGGAFESQNIAVVEIGAHGKAERVDFYDPHHVDQALLRFEEIVSGSRYDLRKERATQITAVEAFSRWLPVFEEALETDDWEALRASCAPGMVFEDRRRFALLSGGLDLLIASARERARAGARVESRLASTAGDRVAIWRTLWSGGPPDGRFEIEYLSVVEVDESALLSAILFFDIDDEQGAQREASIRSVAIDSRTAATPLRVPPNTASRVVDRINSYREAGDWSSMRAACPSIVFEDRRPLFRKSGGCEEFIANDRFLHESGWQRTGSLLATAGDRLALHRSLWNAREEGQPSEVDTLDIFEVDAEGRVIAVILFDAADRAAASAELFERRQAHAIEDVPPAAAEFMRAINTHDLGRLRAVLPDQFIFHDHRRTGLGRIAGADAYLDSVTAMWGLSDDVHIEQLYEVATGPHGRVMVARTCGTNSTGGDFESVYVALMHFDREGVRGMELFEVEDFEAAKARFEELRPDSPFPPNAAMRARTRLLVAASSRDWTTVRALVSNDFRYEDRGKRALVSGDVETLITSMQFTTSLAGFQNKHETLGALGDRILVDRMLWTGGSDRSAFETEHIWLLEVDADDRICTVTLFDPDDRSAAFLEGLERFAAGEAAGTESQAISLAFMQAFVRHDWEGVLRTLAPGFVLVDHRTPALLGTLDASQWIESMRAAADLSPDLSAEVLRLLAWNRHGFVSALRQFGTVPDGGPFEKVFLVVGLIAKSRVQRWELYEIDDSERAIARFEELCAACE